LPCQGLLDSPESRRPMPITRYSRSGIACASTMRWFGGQP
jgi:hypothetical protein